MHRKDGNIVRIVEKSNTCSSKPASERAGCSVRIIFNKHIQALKLFSQYIRETGMCGTGFVLERLEAIRGNPTWLTKREIQLLYEVTSDSVLGIRDRAMLAVYYGCSLRLNEGPALNYGMLSVTDGYYM